MTGPDDDVIALAFAPGVGAALVPLDGGRATSITDDPLATIAAVEAERRPRWAVWSSATAADLAAGGLRISRCWDAAVVHRLAHGGARADPGRVWALLHGLSSDELPSAGPANLFTVADGEGSLVRPDGHLDPEWVVGGWGDSIERLEEWAGALASVVDAQRSSLSGPTELRTAHAESTAELLCVEMGLDGLPMDRAAAEGLIAAYVGPRPRDPHEAAQLRDRRDQEVLSLVPQGIRFDLRSPTQVRSMLRTVGVDVPDTRAWRLEELRDQHPLVEALLRWRKAERVQTTFGYGWLDEHLGPDGRFRGEWSGCDGAAGRMTASAGLHNMPADLRGGVRAEPGHVFVRADLGQIEPRVLASVSGDPALAIATQADDLYAPVAAELGVDRATAKVAVLGAMYGQTTGEGARALVGLRRSYPVAMDYLDSADRKAQVGTDLRTYGGRLVPMGSANVAGMSEREARARAAARGRYGRNAMVQGAAAELFKMWAVTVRARGVPMDARVVLCLHDELLVHVPASHGEAASAMVDESLLEAAARWAPDRSVRFLAETSVVASWSDPLGTWH